MYESIKKMKYGGKDEGNEIDNPPMNCSGLF
jgi:hypothetical protein